MPDQNPVLLSIQRTLRWIVIATVTLYLITLGAIGYVYVESTTNHNALCTFRGQLEDQVTMSNRFLSEHPKGFPGISTQTILEGIHRQELAITALGNLSC